LYEVFVVFDSHRRICDAGGESVGHCGFEDDVSRAAATFYNNGEAGAALEFALVVDDFEESRVGGYVFHALRLDDFKIFGDAGGGLTVGQFHWRQRGAEGVAELRPRHYLLRREPLDALVVDSAAALFERAGLHVVDAIDDCSAGCGVGAHYAAAEVAVLHVSDVDAVGDGAVVIILAHDAAAVVVAVDIGGIDAMVDGAGIVAANARSIIFGAHHSAGYDEVADGAAVVAKQSARFAAHNHEVFDGVALPVKRAGKSRRIVDTDGRPLAAYHGRRFFVHIALHVDVVGEHHGLAREIVWRKEARSAVDESGETGKFVGRCNLVQLSLDIIDIPVDDRLDGAVGVVVDG